MPFILFQMSLQVFYDNYYLYIFAPDNEWRQKWVTALKEGKQFRTLYFRPTDYWAPLIWNSHVHKLDVSTLPFLSFGLI